MFGRPARMLEMSERVVKSAAKRVLRIFGHDVELASRLGIKAVRRSDIFLTSYPKSGNTWVRFLLANLIQDREATFHDLDKHVPDIHKCRERINKMPSPRLIKTHFAFCDRYPKLLYICRDGRDVMVSFFHFQQQLGRFDGTFSEFIRSRKANVFGLWQWHEHVACALWARDKRPDDVLLVRYEDLLEDPSYTTRQIAQFCAIDTTHSRIEKAAELCSFKRLQEIEQRHGGAGEVKSFMRKGTKNQWPAYFGKADLEFFDRQAGEVLRELGYTMNPEGLHMLIETSFGVGE